MLKIELNVDPVSWLAPKFNGWQAYDKRAPEKRATRYLIAQQYKDPPFDGYTHLFFTFTFKVPKSASKAKKADMLARKIVPTRSDCTNLQKFYEDCLKGIVITDDRNVEIITSQKLYGEKGHVTIEIWSSEEWNDKYGAP
jgi:Holliday junction resolvase RusA-like endonuclease